jgi:hypothetical protein
MKRSATVLMLGAVALVVIVFLTLSGILDYHWGRFVFWISKPGADFWTAAAAIVGAISAVIAAVSTYLSFLAIRSQNEPHIVIYVKHDESRQTILMIVVENVGNTSASDLTFTSSRPLPAEAYSLSENDAAAEPAKIMTTGPLIEGIPTLGPKDSRKVNWGQYHGLQRALKGTGVTITCRYKHGSRPMPLVSAVLEVNSFANTAALETEGARMIRELKRIADALQKRLGGHPKPAI